MKISASIDCRERGDENGMAVNSGPFCQHLSDTASKALPLGCKRPYLSEAIVLQHKLKHGLLTPSRTTCVPMQRPVQEALQGLGKSKWEVFDWRAHGCIRGPILGWDSPGLTRQKGVR